MKVGTDAVLLGAWINVDRAKRILDIGTGSGVIAVMIAQRTSDDVLVDAIDYNEEDYAQATENFAASPWSQKLKAHLSSVQQFNPNYQYDLIVSNQPYFSNSLEPPDVKRRNVRHTSTLSFDDLLTSTIRLLTPKGRANFILPTAEGEDLISKATSKDFYCTRKTSFRSKAHKPVERLLLEFSKKNESTNESTIILYDKGNLPSEEYRSLTSDFYLNF
jgi:tRNA1Val (adenine37-N6)-methyltransferase